MFDAVAPGVDEKRRTDEAPDLLARRLADAKVAAVARRNRGAVVIGSDQVAVIDGQILGKPGCESTACAQLARASGRDVAFLTAVCVRSPGTVSRHLDVTRVAFRELDPAQIERYVATEKPLDCAGSFKAEGLGIALFTHIESRDPTGLIGLPLIWLAAALRERGYRVP